MGDPIQRSEADGRVEINRIDENLEVLVTHNGEHQRIVMTPWNARRIFGMLSILLDLPLSKNVGKQIDLGNREHSMTMGPSRPLETIGDRAAYAMVMGDVLKRAPEILPDGWTAEMVAKKKGGE